LYHYFVCLSKAFHFVTLLISWGPDSPENALVVLSYTLFNSIQIKINISRPKISGVGIKLLS